MTRPLSSVRRRPRGVLAPGQLLTADACMTEAGIGRDSLSEARKSGMVVPIEKAGRRYYKTEELIAWILQTGKRVTQEQQQCTPSA